MREIGREREASVNGLAHEQVTDEGKYRAAVCYIGSIITWYLTRLLQLLVYAMSRSRSRSLTDI